MNVWKVDDNVHIFIASVVKYFDTVDRNILDCVLSRTAWLVSPRPF